MHVPWEARPLGSLGGCPTGHLAWFLWVVTKAGAGIPWQPVLRRSGAFRGGSSLPKCPSRGVSCSGCCFVLLCLGLALIIHKRNPLMPASARVRGGGPRWGQGHRESFLGPQDREGGQGSYQLDSSSGTRSRTAAALCAFSVFLLLLPGRQGRRPLPSPSALPRFTQAAGRPPPARVSCGPGLGHKLHRQDPTASHSSLGERAALGSLTFRQGHRSEESVGKFREDTKPRTEAEPGGASSHS